MNLQKKKKSYSINGAWCLLQSKCSISIYEVNEWFPEKTEGQLIQKPGERIICSQEAGYLFHKKGKKKEISVDEGHLVDMVSRT